MSLFGVPRRINSLPISNEGPQKMSLLGDFGDNPAVTNNRVEFVSVRDNGQVQIGNNVFNSIHFGMGDFTGDLAAFGLGGPGDPQSSTLDLSDIFEAEFDGEKLLLERWSQAVGLLDGKLAEQHHESLDKPEVFATVQKILSTIQQRLTRNGTDRKSGETTMKEDSHTRVRPDLHAVLLRNLVLLLYKVVPPTNLTALTTGGLAPTEASSSKKHGWIDELQRIVTEWDRKVRADEQEKMHSWILGSSSTIEPDISTYEHDRLDHTCDWVLDLWQFKDWSSSDFTHKTSKALWIHGPPGFGKTMLCARIIQHLLFTSKMPTGYFFFSYVENRQNPFTALRWWIAQMLSVPSIFDVVRSAWASHTERTAPQVAVIRLLEQIMQLVPGCTFVVDGLDECSTRQETGLSRHSDVIADFLSVLWKAAAHARARILITSRDEPEVRRHMQNRDIMLSEYKLTRDDVRKDIELYSRSIVDNKLKIAATSKHDVALRLAERCEGQFLWLRLFSKSLRGGYSQRRLDRQISETPVDLRDYYHRSFGKIRHQDSSGRDRAISILTWMTFAFRPLTINEITEALLIEEGEDDFPVEEMPMEVNKEYIDEWIIEICGGFIELRSAESKGEAGLQTVHFPHFTVKEYLHQALSLYEGPLVSEADQNMKLARSCLRYINFPSVWMNEPTNKTQSNPTMLYCFREYAAMSWHQHIGQANGDDHDIADLIEQFFDISNDNWDAWERWVSANHNIIENEAGVQSGSRLHYACRLNLRNTVCRMVRDHPGVLNSRTESGRTPISLACELGLDSITQILLDAQVDADVPCNNGRSPLYRACENGHFSIVEILLKYDAAKDIPDKEGRTPLYVASQSGHDKLVRLLLGNDVDHSVVTINGWTSLNVAARRGHLNVVRLLIEKGADITAPDNSSATPLYNACIEGHAEVVRLLIKCGADVAQPNSHGMTPLYSACLMGHLDIVQLLIEHEADIKLTKDNGWTPVNAAASNGHVEVVKLLIHYGADIAQPNSNGMTPLYSACSKGHLDIVQLLIEHEAEIKVASNNGWTPVNAAASNGYVEVVRLLITFSANIAQPNSDGMTPLYSACINGHHNIVQLLIEHKADIEVASNDGWTPVNAAAINGHVEVVKLLIQHGANIAQPNSSRMTPLYSACVNGHLNIVQLLIENKADMKATSNNEWTPVHAAAGNGHVEVVKLLVQHGADIVQPNSVGMTPLYSACSKGHLNIAQLLIEHKANTKIASIDGWTPVYAAANNGHVEVVKLLIHHGADIAQPNNNEMTPLYSACINGHLNIVQLLIEHKADIKVASNTGWTPVNVAAGNGHVKVVKLLIQHGADIAQPNSVGMTPLYSACLNGHLNIVKLLIEHKADIKVARNNGWTPVNAAANNGHVEVVKLLIHYGADIAQPNSNGMTPLYSACSKGHLDIVQLLIEHKADIKVASNDGRMPVHAAADDGYIKVVRLLIKCGADIEVATNDDGWTPLISAAYNGHFDLVRLLLQHNPDCASTQDKFARSALFYAAARGHAQTLSLLLPCGIVDYHDRFGLTPLIVAVINGQEQAVRSLLAVTSVDVQKSSLLSHSPLWWANETKQVRVGEILLQYDGVELCQSMPAADVCVASNNSKSFCDVCIRYIPKSSACYSCGLCIGGGFVMCVSCFEAGMTCLGVSHEQTMRSAE